MNESTPSKLDALHHVALRVRASAFERSVAFYRDQLGMSVVWQPDPDNIYLSLGTDNLALHAMPRWDVRWLLALLVRHQYLDHIGFRLPSANAVDVWYRKLRDAGVRIIAKPVTHRDKTRSFYCLDPNGISVQLIHHPKAI